MDILNVPFTLNLVEGSGQLEVVVDLYNVLYKMHLVEENQNTTSIYSEWLPLIKESPDRFECFKVRLSTLKHYGIQPPFTKPRPLIEWLNYSFLSDFKHKRVMGVDLIARPFEDSYVQSVLVGMVRSLAMRLTDVNVKLSPTQEPTL